MKIGSSALLVACEYSNRVTTEFRNNGVEAYSCDIKSVDSPWHIQDDAYSVIRNHNWNAVIAFPPCQKLTKVSARWRPKWKEDGTLAIAFNFALSFMNCAPLSAVENPIGIINSHYRKPDQIIQPWWFGEHYTKATCLWLNNLPKLTPTNIVVPRRPWIDGGGNPQGYMSTPKCDRDLTFKGVAKAMADQWSPYILKSW